MANPLRIPDGPRCMRAFALAVDPGDTLSLLMEIGALGGSDPTVSLGRCIGIVRCTREALVPAYDRGQRPQRLDQTHTISLLREALTQPDCVAYLAYHVRDNRRLGDDGKWNLVVTPEEARIVELIFTWYVHGDRKAEPSGPMTIAEITHRLTEMKVPTQIDLRERANVKRRGYGVWVQGTVWSMLKNETYAGRWTYADTSLEVSVPQIIMRIRPSLTGKTHRCENGWAS